MKRIKKALVALLCLAMIFGAFNVQSLLTKAATKPTLWDNKLTIPLGKQDGNEITIRNSVKGATYTYTSSNKKIVTVSKKGVPTGVKAGKAKITVTQTYKGKKTKVGTCSIVVKSATLDQESYELNYRKSEITKDEYYYYNLNYWYLVNYAAVGAKYTYTSSDSSVLKINSDGVITKMGQPGKSATVTVKETYKKKTRTVGKITFKIRVPALTETEVEMGLNEWIYPYDYFTGYSGTYYIICSDSAKPDMDNSKVVDVDDKYDSSDDVLEFVIEDGDWYGGLKAKNIGTAYVHCYMAASSAEISADTYLGTIKVTVKEINATLLTWDESDDTEIAGVLQAEYEEEGDTYRLYYTYEPDNCSDPLTVTSSDTNVATIEPDTYRGKVELIIKGEGTTTITVKLGNYTITKKISFTKMEY